MLDGDPAASQKRGGAPPQFSSHFYCGQTARCIKMPLGMDVGLSLGDFVLDGDPVPLPQKGADPQIFGPCLLWPNGWMDQDGTWHGGISLSSGDFVLDEYGLTSYSVPLQKGSKAPSPIFGPFLLWPNGWMHQDATWYGGRAQPRGRCVTWGPSPPSQKGEARGQFSVHVYLYCGQTAGSIKMALWHGHRPWSIPHCSRWDPSPLPRKGAEPPNFRPIFIVAKRLDASRCHCVWR